MSKRFLGVVIAAAVVLSVISFGCKGKVEKAPEQETSAAMADLTTAGSDSLAALEPAQTVAVETIPPSAAPEAVENMAKPVVVSQEKSSRDMEIQKALKNAGFYSGAIDGKIGLKTKTAIDEFQKSKGLKIDGKVGPRTWAELEKYLSAS